MGIEYWVIGPPGTGKTTWLSKQIKSAVESRGPSSVFISSFTRAAAVELAGRRLPVPKDRVGTLHAHCYRALGRPEIAETHIDEWNKEKASYQLSEGDANFEDTAQERVFKATGDEVFSRYQLFRARLVPRQLWPADVINFARSWEAWKADNDLIDFTDMIELALQDIEEAPGSPAVAFFDEVQDMSPLELALMRKWKHHTEMTILAFDDDQMIYSFRGASVDALLYPGVEESHKRVLAQSYRVPQAVHNFAQQWVSQLSAREQKEYCPRDFEGSVVRIPQASFQTPERLVMQIEEDLANDKSVMVLGACSYMLQPLVALLRKQGLPFHNPYRRSRGDWNPLQVSHGVGAKDRLLAFLRPDVTVWGDDSRFWTTKDLQDWTEHLDSKRVLTHGAKKLIDQLPDTVEGLEGMITEWFSPEALDKAWDLDLRWFADALLASKVKLYGYPLAVASQRGAGALRVEPRIVVGTIHSVKGGEADVVYLFPDLSRAGMDEYMRPGPSRDSVIRQFYVGATRAKETLVLCGPATPFAVNFNRIQPCQPKPRQQLSDTTLAAIRIFDAVEVK